MRLLALAVLVLPMSAGAATIVVDGPDISMDGQIEAEDFSGFPPFGAGPLVTSVGTLNAFGGTGRWNSSGVTGSGTISHILHQGRPGPVFESAGQPMMSWTLPDWISVVTFDLWDANDVLATESVTISGGGVLASIAKGLNNNLHRIAVLFDPGDARSILFQVIGSKIDGFGIGGARAGECVGDALASAELP